MDSGINPDGAVDVGASEPQESSKGSDTVLEMIAGQDLHEDTAPSPLATCKVSQGDLYKMSAEFRRGTAAENRKNRRDGGSGRRRARVRTLSRIFGRVCTLNHRSARCRQDNDPEDPDHLVLVTKAALDPFSLVRGQDFGGPQDQEARRYRNLLWSCDLVPAAGGQESGRRTSGKRAGTTSSGGEDRPRAPGWNQTGGNNDKVAKLEVWLNLENLKLAASSKRDVRFTVAPGAFYDCVMPETSEAMWGPVPLQRLPPDTPNNCRAVTHS